MSKNPHKEHPKTLGEANYAQIEDAWARMAQVTAAHEIGGTGWKGNARDTIERVLADSGDGRFWCASVVSVGQCLEIRLNT